MKKIKKIIICCCDFIIFLFIKCLKKFLSVDEEIWLISERGVEAQDNAYFLYNYIKKNKLDIHVKYIINKNSKDIGKIDSEDIILFRSFKHWAYFIKSSLLISTHILGCSPNYSLFTRLEKNKFKYR